MIKASIVKKLPSFREIRKQILGLQVEMNGRQAAIIKVVIDVKMEALLANGKGREVRGSGLKLVRFFYSQMGDESFKGMLDFLKDVGR
mmetsp:Transcript_25257/g.19026  ORF Transcript_25257/g.19026 Transcript_25257/m.19026 type:complete len:88 (+) Transcript_25257:67-330(+)|eukprot:CAMPEP_0202962312 /NCGR_PEP_ID=MMETSP1396-20130829/6403_1 /ASSEMBLY_ACC=CAM_ASM_000872 /TAXON_ID= /ORGANISM="Pseudokeronopsis sp., Strain Brazil" /LENGTH=87 /DNA_ID=CAMNT_0049682785 /DNA_START=793 /DNA_END=1056 /DNA_ORIENTATION=+